MAGFDFCPSATHECERYAARHTWSSVRKWRIFIRKMTRDCEPGSYAGRARGSTRRPLLLRSGLPARRAASRRHALDGRKRIGARACGALRPYVGGNPLRSWDISRRLVVAIRMIGRPEPEPDRSRHSAVGDDVIASGYAQEGPSRRKPMPPIAGSTRIPMTGSRTASP